MLVQNLETEAKSPTMKRPAHAGKASALDTRLRSLGLGVLRLLCLGAQSSVDRLYELTELVTNWSGPMSIAVFVPDIELGIALRYIQYLRNCHPSIRSQVSFHLIYPADHPGVQEVTQELVPHQEVQGATQELVLL